MFHWSTFCSDVILWPQAVLNDSFMVSGQQTPVVGFGPWPRSSRPWPRRKVLVVGLEPGEL